MLSNNRSNKRLNQLVMRLLIAGIATSFPLTGRCQSVHPEVKAVTVSETSLSLTMRPGLNLYVDPATGITADEAVAYALEHNGELLAVRKEVAATSALVRQAGLKANPMLE